MQNAAVAISHDSSKPGDRKPAPAHDSFFDPLPVPEATESDTDTAWGLWEHTLQGGEDPQTEPAELTRQDFADTVPSDLIPLKKEH